MRLTVTGHRPPKVGGYRLPNFVHDAVIRELSYALDDLAPEAVITGMALGVDQWAARLCIEKGINFIAAIPFASYSSNWPEASRWEYDFLLSQAKEVVVVSPATEYHPSLIPERNDWMLMRSNMLLAVWNGASHGNTYQCLSQAWRMGQPTRVLTLEKGVWDTARAIETELEARKRGTSQMDLFQQGARAQMMSRMSRVKRQTQEPEKTEKAEEPTQDSLRYVRKIEI